MSQSLEFKIPEGYVFDKDNSTDEIIRFKPIKKKITYNDIYKELFLNSACSHNGNINASSRPQLEQLLALNKLMNVAKYLNSDWEPDFTNKTHKCHILYDYKNFRLTVDWAIHCKWSPIHFKSKELALQAIEILGEEEVKKALGIFE